MKDWEAEFGHKIINSFSGSFTSASPGPAICVTRVFKTLGTQQLPAARFKKLEIKTENRLKQELLIIGHFKASEMWTSRCLALPKVLVGLFGEQNTVVKMWKSAVLTKHFLYKSTKLGFQTSKKQESIINET